MPFEQLERRLRRRQLRAGEELARLWKAEMESQLKANGHVQTGELLRSLQADVERSGNSVRVVAKTGDLIQAKTTNRGARPHVIVPRRPGGVLVFEVDGETVFAKRVNHPGNAGSGWFDEAARRARGRLVRQAWRAAR